MNKTNLSYHGKVELIKKGKDGRVISRTISHNEGTESLFELFAKALVGVYKNNYTPTHVQVYNNGSAVGQPCPISGLVYISRSNLIKQPHVKLTAVIPYNSNYTEDNLTINLMSRNTILATYNVGDAFDNLTAGQSFLLNWYLYIANEAEVETNTNATESSTQNAENNGGNE